MNFKNQIPPAVRQIAEYVPVRVAGGAVRDLLLGIEAKDWDLATPWIPEKVTHGVRGGGFDVIPTGLKHGTVTVVVDGEPFEITTLRIDTNHDGRHADVEFTDNWREDSARRDFTVNSMFLDMDGNIHDYFGGQDDLKARVIRFVGDPDCRMREDFLRILRLYRFCGKLGKESCPETHTQAVRRNAHGLQKISGERLWSEMRQILQSEMPSTLLSAMKDAGILPHIGLADSLHTMDLFQVAKLTKNPVTRLVAVTPTWLPSSGAPALLETLKDRWKISSPELKLAKFLMDNRGSHNDIDHRYLQAMMVLEGASRVQVVELAALLLKETDMRFMERWEPPVMEVDGNDILALGVKPGPAVGKILTGVKTFWVWKNFEPSRRELLEHAKELNV